MSLSIEGSKANINYEGLVKITNSPKRVILHSNKISTTSTQDDLDTTLCVADFSGVSINNNGKMTLMQEQTYLERLFYHSDKTTPSQTTTLGISSDMATIDVWQISRSDTTLLDLNFYVGIVTTDSIMNKVIPVTVHYDWDTNTVHSMESTASSHHKPFIYSITSDDIATTEFALTSIRLTNNYQITNGTQPTNIFFDDFNKLTITFQKLNFTQTNWLFF